MKKFCIICLRTVEELHFTSTNALNNRNGNDDRNCSLVKRFFKLLRNYLGDSAIKSCRGVGGKTNESTKSANKEGKWNLYLCLEEQLIKADGGGGLLDSCTDCLPIIQSFCELFHQLNTIELLLNWKLWKVKSIMSAAAKVPSRIKHLEEAICSFSSVTDDDGNQTGNKEIFKTLLGFKRFLVKACSQKLARSPPHVLLQCQTLRKRTDAETETIPPETSSVLPDGPGAKDTNNSPTVSQEFSLATTSNDAKVDDTCPPLPVATLPNTVNENEETEDTLPEDSSSVLLIATYQHQEQIAEEHLPPDPFLDITDDSSGEFSAEDSAENSYAQQTEMNCPEPELSSSVLEKKIKSQSTTVVASQANSSVQDNFASVSVDEVEANAACTNWIPMPEAELDNLESKPIPSISAHSPDQNDNDLIKDDQSVCRPRSLRTVHRCKKCNRTFSSKDRLQHHQETECQSSLEEEEEAEQEQQHFSDYDADTDTTNTSDSEIASDIELMKHIEMKPNKPMLHLNWKPAKKVRRMKRKNAGNAEVDPKCKKAKHSKRRWIANNYHYRFKCPDVDCQELFRHLHDLLLHRKASNHQQTSDSSSQSDHQPDSDEAGLLITVEILRFSKDPSEFKSVITLQEQNLIKFRTFAKIEVGCDIYMCESFNCNRPFFSKEGLEEHKKLHGSFSCEFCPIKNSFLPTLALHECQAHTKNDAFSIKSKKKCSRCELEFQDKIDYLRHFTSAHFAISTYSPVHSCAICKTYLFPLKQYSNRNGSPLTYLHYKTAHNNCNDLEEDLSTQEPEEPASAAVWQFRNYVFQCTHCDKLFSNVLPVLLHYRKESIAAAAPLLPKVKIKLKVVNKPSKFHDGVRKKSDLKNLEDFAEIEVSTKVLNCSVNGCSKSFLFHSELDKHLELHGSSQRKKEVEKMSCAVCNFKIAENTKRQLFSHYKTNHNLKDTPDSEVYRCEELNCSTYFLKSWRLIKHRRISHNLEGKELEETIKNSKGHTCKDCGHKCKERYSLQQHRLRHHVEEDKVLKCKVNNCFNLFETEEDMERHIFLAHSTLEKVDCPKCGKNITSGPSLNTHMAWHKRQELIKAGLLEKKKPSLVCEQCGKRFHEKEHLRLHMLSHTGPDSWKFQCDVCSRKCMTQQKLDEHLRTHTKEKPFVCQVCGVKYAHRHNLRIHVNSKHGDVVQDIAKKVDKPNSTSRKGIKLKRKETDSDNKTRGRRGRPKKQRKIVEESE